MEDYAIKNKLGIKLFIIILIGSIFLSFPSDASAHTADWGMVYIYIGLFIVTSTQIIVTIIYFILLKVLKRHKIAKYVLHSVFGIVSLLCLYVWAKYFYFGIFDLGDKYIISLGTYLLFIYYFLLLLFSFKWSKGDARKNVISGTLTIIFFVLFFSWVLTPKPIGLKNYWDIPFGSGLWGGINTGYFLFHPITVPALFCLVICLVYSTNRFLYLPKKKNVLFTNYKSLVQLISCAGLTLGLMALFEPAISDPISKLLMSPKIKDRSGDGNNALRWSEYYKFKISKDDILKYPQYANAFMSRAKWRVNNGDYEKALSDYMVIYDILDENGIKPNHYWGFHLVQYYIQVAWLLSTCPNDSVRDGLRAIELAKKAISLYGVDVERIELNQLVIEQKQKKYGDWRNDPVMGAKLLQILAAAYAEAGQFENASDTQQKAYDLLMAHHPTWFEEEKLLLTEQLKSYKENKPWREILRLIRPMYR
jgi:tetratricopeptide (TPR) repeat protein